MTFLLLLVLGFCVGLLGSVFGLGGGIFIVPILFLYAHIPIHQAIATSLVAIIATSSSVAAVNVERGLANMRLGITLEVSTAAGAVLGAVIAGMVSPSVLKYIFAALLFFVAWTMFRKSLNNARQAGEQETCRLDHPLGTQYTDPATGKVCSYSIKRMPAASAISVFAGAISGLLGVGGGIIQVPLMNIVCGVPIKAAAATSNFMLGVTAATSAVVYFRRGMVLPEVTAVVVLGVIAGSALGMRVLARTEGKRLELAFSLIAFAMALKIIF